jgi:hypothetical protein
MSPYADVTIHVHDDWQLARGMQYANAALEGTTRTATAVVLDERGRVLARFEGGRWKRAVLVNEVRA